MTRDGQPIAKLSAWREEEISRDRWSAERHLAWLQKTWKGTRAGPSTDELLAKDRGE